MSKILQNSKKDCHFSVEPDFQTFSSQKKLARSDQFHEREVENNYSLLFDRKRKKLKIFKMV